MEQTSKIPIFPFRGSLTKIISVGLQYSSHKDNFVVQRVHPSCPLINTLAVELYDRFQLQSILNKRGHPPYLSTAEMEHPSVSAGAACRPRTTNHIWQIRRCTH